MLKPRKGDDILDAGCGIGYYCEFLSDSGARVCGIDIDKEAIDMAKGLYPELNFSVCSAGNIAFKDSSFDKVLCTELLEHVEDDFRAVKEICRVTKPDGLILITVPCPEGIFGSLIKNIGHSRDEGFERHFRKGYSLENIKALCGSNGLKLLNYRYSMTFFVEIYMGFTKFIYLLLRKASFNKQSDLKNIDEHSFAMKLNRLFLGVFLGVGATEDVLLSGIIKGHMLILLFVKK